MNSELSKYPQMGKDFNIDRSRRYGLREGDIVTWNKIKGCKVFSLAQCDNNRAIIVSPDDSYFSVTAEHCEIETKVENIS